jgi:hypothetical protein
LIDENLGELLFPGATFQGSRSFVATAFDNGVNCRFFRRKETVVPVMGFEASFFAYFDPLNLIESGEVGIWMLFCRLLSLPETLFSYEER